MAVYLLDTDTLIDYSKRFEPTASWVLRQIRAGETTGICGVNVTEFFSGLPPTDRSAWEEFFSTLRYFPISRSAATRAGGYRYDYARRGIQLHTPDTIVAAVAFEQGAIVVTPNVKHYPMAYVQTLNPRVA